MRISVSVKRQWPFFFFLFRILRGSPILLLNDLQILTPGHDPSGRGSALMKAWKGRENPVLKANRNRSEKLPHHRKHRSQHRQSNNRSYSGTKICLQSQETIDTDIGYKYWYNSTLRIRLPVRGQTTRRSTVYTDCFFHCWKRFLGERALTNGRLSLDCGLHRGFGWGMAKSICWNSFSFQRYRCRFTPHIFDTHHWRYNGRLRDIFPCITLARGQLSLEWHPQPFGYPIPCRIGFDGPAPQLPVQPISE